MNYCPHGVILDSHRSATGISCDHRKKHLEKKECCTTIVSGCQTKEGHNAIPASHVSEIGAWESPGRKVQHAELGVGWRR